MNRFTAFSLGVVLAAVSVGTVNYVSAAGEPTIRACANKSSGVMRYISKGSCKKSETSLKWNQSGPQGLVGQTGPIGPQGPTGLPGGYSSDFISESICGNNGTSLCTIGSIGPGGGYIFYIDEAGIFPDFNYLEVAPADASSGAVFGNNFPVCGIDGNANCESNLLTSMASAQKFQGIGRGFDATQQILNHYVTAGATLNGTAVLAAMNYKTSLADDWYLPTRAELNLVYQNIHRNGLGGFSAVTYWTSSEIASTTGTNPSNAWVIDFRNTQLYSFAFKNVSNRVRAIRFF